MTNSALAIDDRHTQQPLSLIRLVSTISEVVGLHEDLRRFIKDALIEGQDYGTIPGTDKPALYKPGAEKICIAFGCSPKYEKVESDIDHSKEIKWTKKKKDDWNHETKKYNWIYEDGVSYGLYRYLYKCKIVRSDGRELGEGEGVCSTLESKFIDRPRDCENTVCKMSQKRAFVAGVLNAFGLSAIFTQDMEDHHQHGDDNGKGTKPNASTVQQGGQKFQKEAVILDCPMNDKDELKAMGGAKWNNDIKKWSSTNLEAIRRWGPKQVNSVTNNDNTDNPPPPETEIPF